MKHTHIRTRAGAIALAFASLTSARAQSPPATPAVAPPQAASNADAPGNGQVLRKAKLQVLEQHLISARADVKKARKELPVAPASDRPALEARIAALEEFCRKLEQDIIEEPAAKIAQAVPADLAPRYAKWGAANAVVGAAGAWVLAYDMQQAQRRMGAARKAELRVFPDGRVLAYPGSPQVAKPAEMRLAPDELKALLDEVEKDPKTSEHKFETPLGELDAQSQQVALTGLLTASTPFGWDLATNAVVIRRGNRVFVRSFDGLKEPLFERLHYYWIRRTLAGGAEGISKALDFANEQLLARHPEAPKLESSDFLSASFTAHPVDTRLVHFRRTEDGGAFCQLRIHEPVGGTGYVLHDATFRSTGGEEDVWGQRHGGKIPSKR